MDEVVGKMGPGIDLNQQLTEFHMGQACGNEVFEGFGAGRALVCFEWRQDEVVVLNADLTIFPCQEPLDLAHTRSEFRFTLFKACETITRGPGLADHFRAAAWPRHWGNQIGVRGGVPATVFDPYTA
jgi:hypothetical protein